MFIRIGAALSAALALVVLVGLIARRAPSIVHGKRTFRAQPERVWAGLTDPDKIKAWWAPDGWETTLVENDVRIGGKFLFCMKPRGEGDVVCESGVYDDVNPGHALSATVSFSDERGNLIPGRLAPVTGHWPDQRKLEFDLVQNADGVRVDVWQRSVPMIQKFQLKWSWRQRFLRLSKLL